MIKYTIQRFILMIPTIIAVSIISFIVIQLPPGDYLTVHISNLEAAGESVDQATVNNLKLRYGLDRPVHIQYLKWVEGIVTRGDFG